MAIKTVSKFPGISIEQLLNISQQKFNWQKKFFGMLSLTFAAVGGANRLLENRLRVLPKNPYIQALFLVGSLGSGIFALRAIWLKSSIGRELNKYSDKLSVIPTEEFIKLWNNPKARLVISSLLPQCSFTQIHAIWSEVDEERRAQLGAHLGFVKLGGIRALMAALESSKTQTLKELDQLFDDNFIQYVKDMPGLFHAYQEILSSRTDDNFEALLFKISYKMFNPDIDVSEVGKTKVNITIRQARSSSDTIEEKIEVDRRIFQLLFPPHTKQKVEEQEVEITLGPDDPSPQFIKEMITQFIKAKEPPLDWLLNHCKILSKFNIEPYLYRMQSLLYHNADSLEKLTKCSRQEISLMLLDIQPENIKKLKATWMDAKVTSGNLLFAMVYANSFNLKALATKCESFIRTIKDAKQFRSAFDLALKMNHKELIDACKYVLSNNPSFMREWNDLFEMPVEVIDAVCSGIKIESPWEGVLDYSSKQSYPLETYGGFNGDQLKKTIEKMATAPAEKVKSLLELESFATYMSHFEPFYRSIQEKLSQRQDGEEFKLTLFKLYCRMKKFDSVVDLNQIGKGNIEVTMRQAESSGDQIEEKIEIDQGTFLLLFGLVSTRHASINLDSATGTFQVMKEAITYFSETKEPSLDWLLKNYKMIVKFNMIPYLSHLYSLLCSDRAPLTDLTTVEKVCSTLLANQLLDPSKVRKICDAREVKVTRSNFLFAMTYANIFELKTLTSKCQEFIPTIKDAHQFRRVFDHVSKLDYRSSPLVDTCIKTLQENRSFIHVWKDLFEMPTQAVLALCYHTKIEGRWEDMKTSSYKPAHLLQEQHSFTWQQLMGTIEKMATAPAKEVKSLLELEAFKTLIHHCKPLYEPIRENVFKRQDRDDFKLAVHNLYFHVFYKLNPFESPQLQSIQMEEAEFIIEANRQTITLEKVPRAILDSFTRRKSIVLKEADPAAVDKLVILLNQYIQSKPCSLEELLNSYELLSQLEIEPFLNRFYDYLLVNENFEKIPEDMRNEIITLLRKRPHPTDYFNSLYNKNYGWQVSKENIFIYLSLLKHFENPTLRENVNKYIGRTDIYTNEFPIFRKIYQQAELLQDETTLEEFDKLAKKSDKISLIWQNVALVPQRIKNIILDPNKNMPSDGMTLYQR